jgi:alginate O-acetyltransferase complex protein AlgI
MIFNSLEFILLFLPISFFVYFYLNKNKLINLATLFLVLASLFFYSWWNIIFLPLILLSIATNYYVSYLILSSTSSKKSFLVLGLFFNIVLLGYFKYSDFFLYNINNLFETNYLLLNLPLPLAISFFTFQQIAFLVDSYKGLIKRPSF